MIKPVLNINDLLIFIKNNKKITFTNLSEEENMKNLLYTYNYLNIFSLKYFFATGTIFDKNSQRTVYSYTCPTKYKHLKKQYFDLLRFEEKIRNGVLQYEVELKTHFIFFLEKFLKNNNLDFETFLNSLKYYDYATKKLKPIKQETIDTLSKEWERQIEKFSVKKQNFSDYYYLLIKVLSFGTIVNLLNYEYEFSKKNIKKIFTLFNIYLKKNTKFSIGSKIDDLESIVILRNSLCHKESLITFLEKGYKIDLIKTPKKSFLQLRENAISRIYEYYHLKKGKKKILQNNNWIRNYLNYRLKNRKGNFKKIKINV